ncbi:DNA polymerase V [Prevotella sp. khp7]|uniref:Y-family DNA polymerase n=1 Tax=Prevotella sp. khp7 TaxID=1761885 RepID=UPI0008CF329A|nr:DNA methylase [Prevotella sp. khp7]SEW11206.1 DNA polymerase V [Prevotella sp. khp7]
MPEQQRTYIAIDLKSFYASVECVDRGLDPLTTNLVVADVSRTEKTICLAVSPSLKAYGIGGRARLFEVVQRIREVNYERQTKIPTHRLTGKSTSDTELKAHPDWAVDYIAAKPQMAHYIEISSRIYRIYLKYIAPEDIHVYSIDEVIMDVTPYLGTYKMTAHELTMKMIRDVLSQTGITATAGIGTNMYLCKVAMDIMAKKMPADKDGVRIAELDEMSYRRELWDYRPLTKFWRVGRGTAQKLAMYGIDTMGKLARMSVKNEELLYRLFGVNAELLIDHAWGWEPCTMEAVKAYRPETNSFSSGQVLQEPYSFKKARVVIQEMAEGMALNLVSKQLVTDQLVLTVGYDTESLTRPEISERYHGERTTNYYGKTVPKHVHSTFNFESPTSSSRLIMDGATELYDRYVNPDLLIRRLNLTTNHVVSEASVATRQNAPQQLDLFTDYETLKKLKQERKAQLDKERRMQEAQLKIKKRFGKNAILRGLNFEEGATAKERNKQIGGHKA